MKAGAKVGEHIKRLLQINLSKNDENLNQDESETAFKFSVYIKIRVDRICLWIT